jgi:hypothetical protein
VVVVKIMTPPRRFDMGATRTSGTAGPLAAVGGQQASHGHTGPIVMSRSPLEALAAPMKRISEPPR